MIGAIQRRSMSTVRVIEAANNISLYSQLRADGFCKYYTPPGIIDNFFCGLNYAGIPWAASIAITGAALPVISEAAFKLYSKHEKARLLVNRKQSLVIQAKKIEDDYRNNRKEPSPDAFKIITKVKESGVQEAQMKMIGYTLTNSMLFYTGIIGTSMFSNGVFGGLSHTSPVLLVALPWFYYTSAAAKQSDYEYNSHMYRNKLSKVMAFSLSGAFMMFFADLNMATGVYASSFVLSHIMVMKYMITKASLKQPSFVGGFINKPSSWQTFTKAWKVAASK